MKNAVTKNVPRNKYFFRSPFCLFRDYPFILIKYITNLYLDINDCFPNQCQNGGTCVNGNDSYTCSCSAGLTGVNCQTNINKRYRTATGSNKYRKTRETGLIGLPRHNPNTNKTKAQTNMCDWTPL